MRRMQNRIPILPRRGICDHRRQLLCGLCRVFHECPLIGALHRELDRSWIKGVMQSPVQKLVQFREALQIAAQRAYLYGSFPDRLCRRHFQRTRGIAVRGGTP